VARRNLLHRLVASQRLQRHARLELPRKPSPCPHLVSLHHPREYTLTPCPIFQDQLNVSDGVAADKSEAQQLFSLLKPFVTGLTIEDFSAQYLRALDRTKPGPASCVEIPQYVLALITSGKMDVCDLSSHGMKDMTVISTFRKFRELYCSTMWSETTDDPASFNFVIWIWLTD